MYKNSNIIYLFISTIQAEFINDVENSSQYICTPANIHLREKKKLKFYQEINLDINFLSNTPTKGVSLKSPKKVWNILSIF